VFKNVDCFISLRRGYLDKAGMLLFLVILYNVGREMLLPVPNYLHWRPAVTAIDILSILTLTCNDSKTDPWMCASRLLYALKLLL